MGREGKGSEWGWSGNGRITYPAWNGCIDVFGCVGGDLTFLRFLEFLYEIMRVRDKLTIGLEGAYVDDVVSCKCECDKVPLLERFQAFRVRICLGLENRCLLSFNFTIRI